MNRTGPSIVAEHLEDAIKTGVLKVDKRNHFIDTRQKIN